jgi:hypothetical protein
LSRNGCSGILRSRSRKSETIIGWNQEIQIRTSSLENKNNLPIEILGPRKNFVDVGGVGEKKFLGPKKKGKKK